MRCAGVPMQRGSSATAGEGNPRKSSFIVEFASMLIQENVALAPLTTMQVGGPARFFVEAVSTDDVREAVAFAKSDKLPLFILGGGSNLIVSDAGWPGLVMKVAIPGVNHRHVHGTAYFDV